MSFSRVVSKFFVYRLWSGNQDPQGSRNRFSQIGNCSKKRNRFSRLGDDFGFDFECFSAALETVFFKSLPP